MEDNNFEKLGYRLGQMFACVVAACVMAIVIAFTMKFIRWIF